MFFRWLLSVLFALRFWGCTHLHVWLPVWQCLLKAVVVAPAFWNFLVPLEQQVPSLACTVESLEYLKCQCPGLTWTGAKVPQC